MRLAGTRGAAAAGRRSAMRTLRGGALSQPSVQHRAHAGVYGGSHRAVRHRQCFSDRRAQASGAAYSDHPVSRRAGALRRGHEVGRGAGIRDDHADAGAGTPCADLPVAATAAGTRAAALRVRVPHAASGAAMGHGRGVHARRAGFNGEARASGDPGARHRAVVVRRVDVVDGGRCSGVRPARVVGQNECGTMNPAPVTAASLGLLVCHACGLLSRPAPRSHEACCPRCGAHLHFRKPDSITRCWALLMTAVSLYIPANLLPMMHTSSLFGSQSDTIMSGVVYFLTSGSWYLALIIFFASIMVPLLKMIALALLLVTAQLHSHWQQDQRARLYRLVEFVGRWSMLDIYVVAVIVALVQLQGLATIQPGPGAVAFGAVVVLTMFAAMAFDPRLIWDPVEKTHG